MTDSGSETTDPVVGCGISYLWLLPADHVFWIACEKHDQDYNLRAAGELDEETSAAADRRFLDHMLCLAAGSLKLKALAYFMYSIARAWGIVRWRTLTP